MPHEHLGPTAAPPQLRSATALLGFQLPMPLPFPPPSPPALPSLASSSLLLKMLMPALSPRAARKSARRMRREEEADGWFGEKDLKERGAFYQAVLQLAKPRHTAGDGERQGKKR